MDFESALILQRLDDVELQSATATELQQLTRSSTYAAEKDNEADSDRHNEGS